MPDTPAVPSEGMDQAGAAATEVSSLYEVPDPFSIENNIDGYESGNLLWETLSGWKWSNRIGCGEFPGLMNRSASIHDI